ncbi:unnamed protein product [Sphagnum balticum]
MDDWEIYWLHTCAQAGPVITVGLEWGPRNTVAMADIGRLPGYIRIPSLDENNPLEATIPHKILYSGHPDHQGEVRGGSSNSKSKEGGSKARRPAGKRKTSTLNPSPHGMLHMVDE